MSQFEKENLVQKLKNSRVRKRESNKLKGIITLSGEGKCEGKKSLKETSPELLKEVRRLSRKNRVTGKYRSLRTISKELETLGFLNSKGKRYDAMQISRLL